MENYDFYYGTQAAEFERPEVLEIIAKKGINANMAGSKYNLKLNPSESSESKAVIKCSQSSKTTLSLT